MSSTLPLPRDQGSSTDSGAVADWLTGLGLERYAEAFSRNDIDWDIVAELDHETLRSLGVSSLGDRLRLLKAARSARYDATPATAPAGVRIDEPAAEYRQLTLVFCDLVRSSALARRLDAEAYQQLIQNYHRIVGGVVERHGGYVAQYLGDGILAYFGYPVASEHAATAAVRASLEIQSTLSDSTAERGDSDNDGLTARIGVHTGTVVIGNVGPDSRAEPLALGNAPNVAARLQTIAAAGGVVVSDATAALLDQTFRLRGVDSGEIEGIEDLDHAYRVSARAESVTRTTRGTSVHATPLFGRDAALQRLATAWVRTESGNGGVVLITGEAGIGKTRLVNEHIARSGASESQVIRLECSPHAMDSPLHPISAFLLRAVGTRTSDPAVTRQRRLRKFLKAVGAESPSIFEGLHRILQTATPGPGQTLDDHLSPDRLRQVMQTALIDLLERSIERRPLMLVLEDAHWADPTTLDLVQLATRRCARRPLLTLVTTRAEPGHKREAIPNSEILPLDRLGSDEAATLIRALSRASPLSDQAVDGLLERADGNPLFIEELTRSISPPNDVGPNPGVDLPSGNTLEAIPASLRDSLAARLDRLEGARGLAQIASCIGRTFDASLVATISQRDEASVETAMKPLCDAGVIEHDPAGPPARYRFRHALLQEAAYGSQLQAERQRIHERLYEAVRQSERFPPDQLAHHAAMAGRYIDAATHALAAGDAAAWKGSAEETYRLMERAYALVSMAQDSTDHGSLQLSILSKLGSASTGHLGHAHPRTREVYSLAERWLEHASDPMQRLSVLYFLPGAYLLSGKIEFANKRARALLEEGHRTGNRLVTGMAHELIGYSELYLGRFEDADASLATAETYADAFAPLDAWREFDLVSVILSWRMNALLFRGRWRTAWQCALTADQRSEPRINRFGRAFVLHHIGTILALTAHPEASRWIETANGYIDDHDVNGLKPYGPSLPAILAYMQGRHEASVDLNRHCIEIRTTASVGICVSLHWACLAHALAACGQPDEALRAADEARRLLDAADEQWTAAEIHLALGEANLRWLGRAREGRRDILTAMRIARRQDNWFELLRTVLAWSRILVEQGHVRRARRCLSPVVGHFPDEGYEIPDFQAAQALLASLRS